MDNRSELSRTIRRIERGEISREQGLELIKTLKRQTAPAPSASMPERLYYTPEWEKAEQGTEAGSDVRPTGLVLLFDKDDSLFRSLEDADLFDKRVLVVPGSRFAKTSGAHYEIHPASQADYDRLVDELELKEWNGPVTVVHAWLHERFDPDVAAMERQLERGLYALALLSKAWMNGGYSRPTRLLSLYAGPEGSGAQPLHQALSGFMRTLVQECPSFACVLLDVHGERDKGSETLLSALLQELRRAPEIGSASEARCAFGYRSARTYKELERFEADADPVALEPNGAYVIAGGMGGIGYEVARYMAQHVQAKLVLAGRSPENDRTRERLQELQELGGDAIYVRADVSDAASAASLIEQGKARFGPIRGVFHCAGELNDSYVRAKSKEEMAAVLAAKVSGTVHLDRETRGEPLRFFVAFSSVSALAGNGGQADYAFANAFQDAYADWRSQSGAPGRSLSINWPLWSGIGMGMPPEAIRHMEETTGMMPLPVREGLFMLRSVLASPGPDRVVALYGDGGKIRGAFQAGAKPSGEAAGGTHSFGLDPMSQPASAGAAADAEEDVRERLIGLLKSAFAKTIKIKAHLIDPEESFDAYGIDSIAAVNVIRELEKTFGPLSKTLLFECRTMEELAHYLIGKHRETLFKLFGAAEPDAVRTKPDRAEAGEQSSLRNAQPTAVGRQEQPRPAVERAEKAEPSDPVDRDIAIIGLAGRYPLAEDIGQFWSNLQDGKDCVVEIPADRWDYRQWYSTDRTDKSKTHSKWGGFLDGVDRFDPLFFQIAPREAVYMDPQERLFLETVWRTMEDACYTREKLNRGKVSVFVGVMYGQYELYGAEETLKGNTMALSSSFASIANRVSYFFKLTGPSMAVDTMCSSSLTAIHLACDSIRSGESEMAIAGGVNLSLHVNKYLMLSQGNFVASDGRCRSFGEGGDGYVPGEGVGAVLLKPLRQAIADGDRIQGVIKGSAINHGGRTNGYTVPNAKAQSEVIREAYRKANVDPSTVSYVEAHGTGTSLGDPIEMAGLANVFGNRESEPYCAIGSVKSNIGHLESAAGIAAVTKVLLQMKHKRLAPSLHAELPNPNIDFQATSFRLQRRLSEWKAEAASREEGKSRPLPRRAGISSFGAGGSNAHLVIEEYDGAAPRMPEAGEPQLIVLSAPNRSGLESYADALLRFLHEQRLSGSPAGSAVESGDDPADIRGELHALACDIVHQDSLTEERESWDEYGLDPLTLAALAERLNAKYDLDLSPAIFEQYRTLGALAQKMADDRDAGRKIASGNPIVTSGSALRLDDLAYTLQEGREAMEERLAFVAASIEECIGKLEAFVQGGQDQELLTGSSADNRFAFLKGDEAFEAVLDNWLHKGRLEKLAEAWVNGTPIAWNRLRRPTGGRFAALPGYPFQKERYWLPVKPHDQTERYPVFGTAKVHPFLDSNESDLTGLRFRSVMDAADGYVDGYRLAGRPIGSPAVGLELIRAAGELVGGQPIRRMDRIRWSGHLRGLSPDAVVSTRLYARQNGIGVEAESSCLPEGERIFVQAELNRGEEDEECPPVDIARISNDMAERAMASSSGWFMSGADYYEQLEERKASLSAVYAVIEHIVADHREVLLTLHTGEAEREGGEAPAMALVPEKLESAFRAAGILYALQPANRDDLFYMPSAVSRIHVRRTLSACRYAYACWLRAAADQEERLDVLLLDEQGNVLVSLEGIELAPVLMAGAAARHERPAARKEASFREETDIGLPETLKRLLADELQVSADRIGDHTSFMDLGVDSILLADMVPKVERVIGVKVDPSAFLEHPNLRELSGYLERTRSKAAGGEADPEEEAASQSEERQGQDAAASEPEPDGPELPASEGEAAPALAVRRTLASYRTEAATNDAASADRPSEPTTSKRIAVIGMACQFPGAPDKETYWSNLVSGTCSITEVPAERWDTRRYYSPRYERGKSISKWGGFIQGIEWFDPDYFKLSEDEALQMDPSIRKMMEVTADLLRDAGYREEELWGRRVGVFVGTRIGNFRIPSDKLTKSAITGLGQNFAAAQLSHYFNFKGPSIVVDTACSSSLVSIHLACQSLMTDESEVAVAGGVELNFDQNPFLLLSEGKALSPDGAIHAFDEKANGFVLGEGCGAVLLKSLDRAIADGDRIYAVIEGAAVNNDGRTMGITTPNPEAQCDVIREAYRKSGVRPESISYLEAHGTGTMIGDPIELKALGKAFGSAADEKQFCAIGSVKTNLGHLLSAAGVASFMKVALSIHYGQLPPTLNCEKPNPRFAFRESPFYPNRSLQEWKPRHGARRAGISSFGFGGTNAHLVLAGYEPDSAKPVRNPLEPVRFNRRRYWLEPARKEQPEAAVHDGLIGGAQELQRVAAYSEPAGAGKEEPTVGLQSRPIDVIQEEPSMAAQGRPIGVIEEEPSVAAQGRPIDVIQEKPSVAAQGRPIGVIEEESSVAAQGRPIGVIEEEPSVAAQGRPIGVIEEEPSVAAYGRPIGFIQEEQAGSGFTHDRPYQPMLQIMME